MKGIILVEFEKFISETFGEDRYHAIAANSRLITIDPFVGPGTYPDEDFLRLVSTAVDHLQITLPDALRSFGRFCFPDLAKKFPNFVNQHRSAKSFLLTVHDVIHVEVKKLYEDAILPDFTYDNSGGDAVLVIQYRSQRKFCHLMEGLIDGTGKYFGETIGQTQACCLLRGDDCCEFHLSFDK